MIGDLLYLLLYRRCFMISLVVLLRVKKSINIGRAQIVGRESEVKEKGGERKI